MPPKVLQKYDKGNLEKALNAIKAGNLSTNKAATKYGVPRSTLGDKLRGKYRPGKPIGRDPYLSQDEEKAIVR